MDPTQDYNFAGVGQTSSNLNFEVENWNNWSVRLRNRHDQRIKLCSNSLESFPGMKILFSGCLLFSKCDSDVYRSNFTF